MRLTSLPVPFALVLLWLMPVAALPPRASAYPGLAGEIEASSDGRFLAMLDESGELSVLDLEESGTVPIYSAHAEGCAWAPERPWLAYVENPPGLAPSLLVRHPLESEPEKIPLRGFDWIAQPAWIDSERLLFRSDRGSDHVNVWMHDRATGETTKVADCGHDATGVWASPTGGEFLFSFARAGSTELHLGRLGSNESRGVASGPGTRPLADRQVAFSPEGDRAVFPIQTPEGFELVIHDPRRGRTTRSTRLEAPLDSVAFFPRDRIVYTAGGELLEWSPGGWLGGGTTRAEAWRGIAKTSVASLGGGRFAAGLEGGAVLLADSVERLDKAELRARSTKALVDLAVGMRRGGAGRGLAILAGVSGRGDRSPEETVRILLARSWLARLEGRAEEAEDRLEEALDLTLPGSGEATAVWLERLLLSFFEREDSARSRSLMLTLPEDAFHHPTAKWVAHLLDVEAAETLRGWQRAGKLLRARDSARAIRQIEGFFLAAPHSRTHRGGLALLLRGDFEPLAALLAPAERPAAEALDDPRMQELYFAASRSDIDPYMSRHEMRGTLVLHWADRGRIEPARRIIEIDLKDPDETSVDYADMLRRYLDPDEQEPWLREAVADTLLSGTARPLLDRRMNDAESHLIFMLARTKLALSRRDGAEARELLDGLEQDLRLIGEDDWSEENAAIPFLVRVYRAKRFELAESWDRALESYGEAFAEMEKRPRDWGVSAFDLAAAESLVRDGRDDPEGLRRHLEATRGMGDPLVNPTRDPAALETAVEEMRELRQGGAGGGGGGGWSAPYTALALGAGLNLLDRPYQAAAYLREGRSASPPPPPAALARILFEEAAARSSLGQHRLAAELLADLCEMRLDPVRLTVAIKARAQAEKESGFIFSQEDRMRYLCGELRLPPEWAGVLVEAPAIPFDRENRGTAPPPLP